MVKKIVSALAAGQMNFAGVLASIDDEYAHVATAFTNGDLRNSASENQGSARVLFYAQLNNLSKEETLSLFAEHYQHVLDNPGSNNHQNIRQFMRKGWDGVAFEGTVLLPK